MKTTVQSHHDLRKALKQKRLQIPHPARTAANAQLVKNIQQLKAFKHAKHIAAYVGSKGEINPMPLLHIAHALGKQCYLPVLHPWVKHKMLFVPWHPKIAMHNNRFAIPEPAYKLNQQIKPHMLDIVLVPLLGFDQQCNRLGMGGGFYDRTFAFHKHKRYWQRPLLLGVAFDQQQCTHLNSNTWDVAMDAIVTPKHIYQTKKVLS